MNATNTADTLNPYQSPATTLEPPRVVPKAVLLGALWSLAATTTVIAIYAFDPRLPNGTLLFLMFMIVGSALCCGFGGFFTGTVTRLKPIPVFFAHVIACATVAAWIGVGGAYRDVVSAAVMFGWPLGGLLGAYVAKQLVKRRLVRTI